MKPISASGSFILFLITALSVKAGSLANDSLPHREASLTSVDVPRQKKGLVNSPTDFKVILPVEVDVSDLVSNFNVRFQALGDNVTRLGDQLRIVEEENARVQNALKEKVAGLETKLQTSMQEAYGLREQLKASNEQNSKVDDLLEQLKASIEQKGVPKKRVTTNCSGLVFLRPSDTKVYKVIFTGFSDTELTIRNRESILSWQEARLACQDLGGDLAQPETREDQAKIMAVFGKAHRYIKIFYSSWKFWIGIEKKRADITWVSGKKIANDSDLRITPRELEAWKYYGKERISGCGNINDEGIGFRSCSKGHAQGHAQGYVCEFAEASPICVH